MSHSANTGAGVPQFGLSPKEVNRVVDGEGVQSLLGALEDPECRSILDMTSDEPLSAREIAKRGEFPLSTTYRKLDVLSEAELLEERTRIRDSGKHASEYIRAFDHIVMTLKPRGEMELRVIQRA